MQGTSKAEKRFRPGEEVPESGVYAVLHHNHRPKHVATIFKGERFPFCAHCKKDVRFLLMHPANVISEDGDFNKDPDDSGASSSNL
jgi:hypothetical protein